MNLKQEPPSAEPACATQSEFMSDSERLNRINQRIKNSRAKALTGDSTETCSMLYFNVEAKRLAQARQIISKICKDKLIFMRVKPVHHRNQVQVELFVGTSVMQRVKEIMRTSFQCRMMPGPHAI